MFEMRLVDELVQLAGAGAGFTLNAAMRPTLDLVRIATAAAQSGAKVTLTGLNLRQHAELLQIARAGAGNIRFEE